MSNIDTKTITKILKLQLNAGANRYNDEAGVEIPKDPFTNEELIASFQIVEDILISQGYKKPAEGEFIKMVKKYFNRTIDKNSQTKYLYINFFNKCNRTVDYNKNNNVDFLGTYIVKNKNFITDFYYLPELIDYVKYYPEIAKIENSISKHIIDKNGNNITIEFWADLNKNEDKSYNLKEIRKKNIQTLVARNMYLFNNSRAHFRWLIVNDEYFMRSLVTTFGYTEDAELLEWVVEKTNFNDQDELNKLFYNAKCDGRTQLNTAVFPALKKYITPKNKIVLEQLQKYLFKLIDLQNEFAGLHFKERTELIARLSYFGELYRFKPEFEYTNYDNNYFIFSIFTYDTSNRFKTEMKDKNYYGLPDFMKLYDKAEKEYSKYYYKSIGE